MPRYEKLVFIIALCYNVPTFALLNMWSKKGKSDAPDIVIVTDNYDLEFSLKIMCMVCTILSFISGFRAPTLRKILTHFTLVLVYFSLVKFIYKNRVHDTCSRTVLDNIVDSLVGVYKLELRMLSEMTILVIMKSLAYTSLFYIMFLINHFLGRQQPEERARAHPKRSPEKKQSPRRRVRTLYIQKDVTRTPNGGIRFRDLRKKDQQQISNGIYQIACKNVLKFHPKTALSTSPKKRAITNKSTGKKHELYATLWRDIHKQDSRHKEGVKFNT